MTEISSNRPQIGIGVWVVKENKVLLGKRKSLLGEGCWAPPGGHLEFGEEVEQGAARELEEETNLIALNLIPICWTSEIFHKEKKHYVSLHLIGDGCQGELKLMEPTKCEEWRWFTLDNLPQNLFLSAKKFIEMKHLQAHISQKEKLAL